MILSCSDPPKVFDGIPPLKSWFKCDLKVEFLSEVVMGKIMKGGKVVLLLSGRWSSYTTCCPMAENIFDKITPNFEQFQHLISPRYAGRKAVIVKPSDEGTSDKPFRYS